MDMSFAGRAVIITGASVGIGRATAIKFAKEGARLTLLDIDSEKLEAVKAEAEAYGAEVLIFKCDISDEKSVNAVVCEVFSRFGRIDVLVNNAALWRDITPFMSTATEQWQKYIDVNILGTMFVTRAVLRYMIEAKYGRIINVASVAGVYGNKNMAHYSMTKGAVIALTKSLAKEVAEYGITVNATSPGTVSPSRVDGIDYTEPNVMSYAGRTGSGAENADLICFLASENAGYISGQNILIDGCRKNI